jgi:hypothetical protein
VFGVTVRLMSDAELRRLEVLQDLDRRRLTAGSGGAAARAQAAASVSVVEGLSDRRSEWADLETTRSPQQPAQAGGVAARGFYDHPPVVLGLARPLFKPGAGSLRSAEPRLFRLSPNRSWVGVFLRQREKPIGVDRGMLEQ